MSNLAKVFRHLRKEQDQAQSRLDQLDKALNALTRGQRSWWNQRKKQPCPQVRKAQDHVGRRTETDRGRATWALDKMESCSAGEVSGIGPRFPHFHSQIFRF